MTAKVYVSQWPEEKILAYFRTMVREDADRLALLAQLAAVAVRRPDDWSPEAVREEHDATKYRGYSSDKCFCCRTGDRRLYWHHVIAIQHGGSNVWDNKVAICLRCHGTIHPWLDAAKPDPKKRRGGMASMADVVLESLDSLTERFAQGGKR